MKTLLAVALTASMLQGDLTPAAIAKHATPAVVLIKTAGPSGDATGSGFIVDQSGTIITNLHVMAAAEVVYKQDRFGSSALKAKAVGSSLGSPGVSPGLRNVLMEGALHLPEARLQRPLAARELGREDWQGPFPPRFSRSRLRPEKLK